MPLPDLLRSLLTAPGPSGYETAPARVWREAAAEFGAEVSGDVVGSSVARVKGRGDGPLTIVVGHIDEIGLVVRHIDDKGYLWFGGIGGWDPQILVGQRVEVVTRDGSLPGVVGKKPIHLLKDEERKKAPELRDLHIDIGAMAVIAGEPVDLLGERVVSRSMDNRLGAFVAFEAARLVAADGGAPGDVAAVAVTQEEITFAGATTSAFSLEPGVAIVVDVTFATDAPGIDEKEQGKHEMGSGPVITRGSTIHPAVFELLYETVESHKIPFTVDASSRYTGTDADAIHLSRRGVPTGIVSVPLRYMHSPVELVQLDDVHNAARLIAAFAQRVGPGTSFDR